MKSGASKPTVDRGFVRHLVRALLTWLRERTVEQHYSVETLAGLLELTPRTVWNYVELYETSGGADGIGPVIKLSHKVVRIPASSASRLLKAKTITIAGVGDQGDEEARKVA